MIELFKKKKKIDIDSLLDWYEKQLLDFRKELEDVNGLYALRFAFNYVSLIQSNLGNLLLDDRLPECYRVRITSLLDLTSSILSFVESRLIDSDWIVEDFDFSTSKAC